MNAHRLTHPEDRVLLSLPYSEVRRVDHEVYVSARLGETHPTRFLWSMARVERGVGGWISTFAPTADAHGYAVSSWLDSGLGRPVITSAFTGGQVVDPHPDDVRAVAPPKPSGAPEQETDHLIRVDQHGHTLCGRIVWGHQFNDDSVCFYAPDGTRFTANDETARVTVLVGRSSAVGDTTTTFSGDHPFLGAESLPGHFFVRVNGGEEVYLALGEGFGPDSSAWVAVPITNPEDPRSPMGAGRGWHRIYAREHGSGYIPEVMPFSGWMHENGVTEAWLGRIPASQLTPVEHYSLLREDVEMLSDLLNRYAEEQSWCPEYEDVLRRVNEGLTHPLPGRPRPRAVRVIVNTQRELNLPSAREITDADIRAAYAEQVGSIPPGSTFEII